MYQVALYMHIRYAIWLLFPLISVTETFFIYLFTAGDVIMSGRFGGGQAGANRQKSASGLPIPGPRLPWITTFTGGWHLQRCWWSERGDSALEAGPRKTPVATQSEAHHRISLSRPSSSQQYDSTYSGRSGSHTSLQGCPHCSKCRQGECQTMCFLGLLRTSLLCDFLGSGAQKMPTALGLRHGRFRCRSWAAGCWIRKARNKGL